MKDDEGTSDRVRIEIADGVADVRLNRPDKMNAIDMAMFAGIVEASARLASEPGLRAVVLSGEGKAFCAGLDMASFSAMVEGGAGAALSGDVAMRTHGAANLYQQAALGWRQLPVPVIAALHGTAVGGGLQVALGADMRFVTADVKLSVMEIRWGLVPDMAGTLLMRELARADVVRELTYTGRVFTGEEAVALGLATRVCLDPREEALAAARAIAGQSPHAIRAAKRLFNLSDEVLASRILQAEADEQKAILGSPNQIEAVKANLARRAPVFRDAEVAEPGQGQTR